MPAVVPLRPDFDATKLRVLAKRCPDSRQTRRLLALAAVYDGMSCAEAAQVGGMGPPDVARLGSPVQRGGYGWSAQPQRRRPAAHVER